MIKDRAKWVVNKLLTRSYDRVPQPPTPTEQKLVEELRRTFRGLAYEETRNCLRCEDAWKQNVNDLRELVLTANPREFLRWDVISKTMFVKNDRYILTELNELKRRPDWIEMWRESIKEVPIGDPILFKKYPSSSGNLIHHAYHVAQFEEKTGTKVDAIDFVLEFGGGYGCMCRLFHNLNFKGRYVIYDLPHLSALQEYYLKSIGIPVSTFDKFVSAESGVICVSNMETLRKLLSLHSNSGNSLFIAMWSMSETPLNVRNKIFSLVTQFDSYLIAYQDSFAEMDNIAYFTNYKRLYEHVINWSEWSIRHLPGNHYLVGIRGKKDYWKQRADSSAHTEYELYEGAKEGRTFGAYLKKCGWRPRATVGVTTVIKNSVSDLIQDYRQKKDYREWLELGKQVPPPHTVKQMTVKEYANRCGTDVFIETGTYLGEMVSAVRNNFRKIYSIELSVKLYENAKKKFYNHDHISILQGDSSKVLPEILNHLEEPCLFWLDGHYSEGITAKGEKETPILEELKAILNHPVKDHVILIDDARCFTGRNEYPAIEELRELILAKYPDYVFNVANDIIRSHKLKIPFLSPTKLLQKNY